MWSKNWRRSAELAADTNARLRYGKVSLDLGGRSAVAKHDAVIVWKSDGNFASGKYSRAHEWRFDGGAVVRGSSSPHVVPTPWSNAANVDPEEAYVASIASCHMLTFLWLASREGFVVDGYEDEAVGEMTKNDRGLQCVSRVTLCPRISWSGAKLPTAAEVERLHHRAHEECFIANSIKTAVTVESDNTAPRK